MEEIRRSPIFRYYGIVLSPSVLCACHQNNVQMYVLYALIWNNLVFSVIWCRSSFHSCYQLSPPSVAIILRAMFKIVLVYIKGRKPANHICNVTVSSTFCRGAKLVSKCAYKFDSKCGHKIFSNWVVAPCLGGIYHLKQKIVTLCSIII